MKTKRKISVAAYCLALILFVTTLFGATGCDINILYRVNFEDVNEILMNNFSVQLPEGGKLLYYVSSREWMDGEDYHVISYEQEPTEYIADFSYEESEDLKEKYNLHFDWMISALEAQDKTFIEEYAFNWGWEYCCKRIDDSDDTLLLLYRPETLELYVLAIYM